MKNILFAFALGSAVGGLILSICNLATDLHRWWVKRREDKEDA